MDSIIRQFRHLNDDQLLTLSEAIDSELMHREEVAAQFAESARLRANSRTQSYRRSNGSSAPPIRAIGLKEYRNRRAA